MKTLRQLQKKIKQPSGVSGVTAYYPKGGDEQDFVNKHEIEFTDDANGNDDEMFKGTKVKKINRAKERHGYDSPKDQTVHEEIIDEKTLSSSEMKKKEKYVKGMKKKLSSFRKRYGADAKSVMYATATKMAKEEIEQVDEISKDLAKKYLEKTVDPIMGMPKPLKKGKSIQVRMKGIEKASKKLKEENYLDVQLLQLFANLNDSNKAQMLEMIENGNEQQLLDFINEV